MKKTQLARCTLSCQGLAQSKYFGRGVQGTINALERLGYVQIDTLAIIERAHHHTMWNRIPDYKPGFLGQLVQAGQVFEYWFHAASYLPIRDYRYCLPRMSAIKRGETGWFSSIDKKLEKHIHDRIKIDGPLKSRDFEVSSKQKGSWWDWKPTKLALEKLFMQGDLMIAKREGMEKVYDLRERVLPPGLNTQEPLLPELAKYLVDITLQAHGFSSMKQITHLRSGSDLRKAIQLVLLNYLEEGHIVEYNVEGMTPVYASQEIFDKPLKKIGANIRFLSPFDNAIIHRDRAQQLFDFDYKLECYTPKEKRKYGYFCLPILYSDELVGRMDCKAHRKERHFEVISLYIEKKIKDDYQFIVLLLKKIIKFSLFNECDRVSISAVKPKKWLKPFNVNLPN